MATRTAQSDTPKRAPAIDERTATALKLFVVLERATAALGRRAEENAARHGLTIGEFAVLEALYHRGPMLLGEVQRRALVSSGGITFLVDRLEQKGFATRKACATDRRARYAALTPAGAELMSRIFPDHARALADAMSALAPDEQRTATDLLRRLGKAAAGDDLPD